MIKKISTTTIVAFILCIAIGGSIFAADTKRYPGGMCLPAGYVDENYWMLGDLGRLNAQFYNESSSETLGVFCPIMTDEITYYSANITINNYATEEFWCVINSFNPVTGAGWQSAAVSTTASGLQNLPFNVSNDSSYSRSIHSILCFVPPKSKILRYDISEDGGNPS